MTYLRFVRTTMIHKVVLVFSTPVLVAVPLLCSELLDELTACVPQLDQFDNSYTPLLLRNQF